MEKITNVLTIVKTKATTNDPCFGCCTLQKASMGVAIFNIVIAAIAFIVAIIIALFMTTVGVAAGVEIANTKDEEGLTPEGAKATGSGVAIFITIISIILIIIYAAVLALGILLYIGTKKRDYSKVHLWFTITIVCVIILLIDALAGLSSFSGLIRLIITLVVIFWELWVVYAFMHEIDPDNLAVRLEGGHGGEFQGIPANADEVQFSKNPYDGQGNTQPTSNTTYGQPQTQPDPYGWDN